MMFVRTSFTVHPQHVMPVVELFQHAVQFAAESPVLTDAKDLSDDVGGQAKHTQFARALEDLMKGEMPPENKIATVLDLVQGIVPPQVDRGPILLRELWTQHQRLVIEPLTDH